jgi:hypothetical protein
MRKRKHFGLEPELWERLDAIVEAQGKGYNKALLKLIHDQDQEIKTLKQKLNTSDHAVSYVIDGSKKALVFRRDINVIKNGLKRIETKLERLKSPISEPSRHMSNEPQRLKADSKQKKPSEGISDPAKTQQSEPEPKKRWRRASDWEKRLRTPIRSDGGKLCLFPSYLKKEPVYSLDCRKCEQDPDSPFKQCAKLWEEALSTQ